MKKIKLVLYWISVIPVIIDCVKGAIVGVKKGLADLKDERQQRAFDKSNR